MLKNSWNWTKLTFIKIKKRQTSSLCPRHSSCPNWADPVNRYWKIAKSTVEIAYQLPHVCKKLIIIFLYFRKCLNQNIFLLRHNEKVTAFRFPFLFHVIMKNSHTSSYKLEKRGMVWDCSLWWLVTAVARIFRVALRLICGMSQDSRFSRGYNENRRENNNFCICTSLMKRY